MLGRLHGETAQRYKGQPTEPQPLNIFVISAQAPDLRATGPQVTQAPAATWWQWEEVL